MGVQGQVIGQQIDVMRQQQCQSLLEPTGDAAIVAAPKQAVVNQQSVSAIIKGGLDEGQAGRHPRDDFFNLGTALYLQPVGTVVFEQLRLQQLVAQTKKLMSLRHVSGAQF
jgi:hypothetical protein